VSNPFSPVTGAATLRVLLVDDEPLARARLRDLLADCAWPPVEVAGEAGSAAEALHWLSHNGVAPGQGGSGGALDLVLLDIQMPGLDGIALAERLRTWPQAPAVVFVTAHPEHALRAFELAAVDYLQKPVRRARLQEALARVAERRGVARPARAEQSAAADDDTAANVLVQDRGRLLRVPLADVLYLRAEQKYVTVRTAHAAHVIDESLTDLEPRLGHRFLRVHRNALVAVGAMCELQRRRLDDADDAADGGEAWAVRVAPVDEWLAVSRRQLQAVKDALRQA
jgi:two-component system, LytTR family, response regulator AlgR